jgi:ribosome maturation factor RimP
MSDSVMDALQKILKSLVIGALDREGFDLVNLVVRGKKTSPVIQFVIDGEAGVTVSDCAHISRMLSDILELESERIGLNSYRLEVSSPGVDRPLSTERDFRRNVGRNVWVVFHSGAGRKEIVGKISGTTEDTVVIDAEDEVFSIEFSSITKAKIQLDW